ncbi:MAG: alkaline phosphatase family protein [Clostridiales bacterium]|nr:alkaline phosphatase family protein [Clostridiales bacterium]
MNKKVILILVDGMRPDGFIECGNPFINEMLSGSSYTLDGRSVFPSVTLPCHMSLFHSVDPERHGVTTNTYVPQVRPIKGLIDRLGDFGKRAAIYYTWEELRDISRPDAISDSLYISGHRHDDVGARITDAAVKFIQSDEPDFLFLYIGKTDSIGHKYGWMSPEYIEAVNDAVGYIEKVYRILGDEYVLIVTADHGGHGRSHGEDIPEDMTIPFFFFGDMFEKGKVLGSVSLKDVAPTVTELMGVPAVEDWEGHSILSDING